MQQLAKGKSKLAAMAASLGFGRPVQKQSNKVLDELKEIMEKINHAETRFNLESDSTLVEADIYDLKALQTRMKYLLEKAKNEKISSEVIYQINFEKE